MDQESTPSLSQITLAGKTLLVNEAAYDPVILAAMRRGGYETGEREVLPKLLVPGDRVLEIGTAVGLVAMVAAGIVGAEHVVCFEANPRMVEDATRNFAANGLAIAIHNKVLQNFIAWQGPGSKSRFFMHKEFWASSLADKPGTVGSVEVPNACLEHELRAFRANVIVCDIEGGEIDLLTTSDLSGVDRILLEIHYWAGRAGINRMMRKLMMDGFSIDFDLSGRSIVVLHRGLDR